MVAPSRSSTRITKPTKPTKNTSIRQAFGRVSKANVSAPENKSKDVVAVTITAPAVSSDKKRKRTREEQNVETDIVKRLRVSTSPTPVSSRVQNAQGLQTKLAFPAIVAKVEEEDEVSEYAALPQSLNTLVSLHEACLKAMTLHFAHNGTSAPANLSNFLENVTRLWKKRQVQKQDIRKMMALIELDASTVLSKMGDGQTVQRSKGYFKLFQSGLGIQHLLIEYIGGTSLNERRLQQEYSSHIHDIWQQAQNNVHLITNLSDPSKIPEITVEVGAQQAARHEKAKNLRNSILSPQQPQTQPSAKSQQSQPANASGRKETLLDRILAKQRAALSTPQPTTQELALHRAKGRVSELADILNIIQKQRTRNQAISRISFSFGQLVLNIKDSVRVPISEEEISFGLEVLARENVAGTWISMTEMGEKAVRGGNGWEGKFVVLNGRGFSGAEIQERVSGL